MPVGIYLSGGPARAARIEASALRSISQAIDRRRFPQLHSETTRRPEQKLQTFMSLKKLRKL
ncbi:MAG: hypothetical protein ABW043_03450 [Devosia sp.]|uniref:hypothetical protein n=1 Tax=Devosia sp. TaxID=1871048 RepID=UPI003393B833